MAWNRHDGRIAMTMNSSRGVPNSVSFIGFEGSHRCAARCNRSDTGQRLAGRAEKVSGAFVVAVEEEVAPVKCGFDGAER
jgi:hypothetical protein